MMLGFANDNFIAGLQARPDVALRHHIDGLGGPRVQTISLPDGALSHAATRSRAAS